MVGKSNILEIIIRAKDLASGAFKQVQLGINQIGSGASKVWNSLFNLKNLIVGLAAGAVVTGIYKIGKALTGMASAGETARLQFEAITGSAAEAQDMMDFAKGFEEKNVIFKLSEIRDGLKEMSVRGLDAKADMTAVGDAAAATGKNITEVASDIGTATMGMFRGLRQYGIQASAEGDKVVFKWRQNGVDMVKVAENTSAGMEAALRDVFEAKFGGAMAKFKNSWAGMWAVAENVWDDFKRKIMSSGVFEYMKTAFGDVINIIDRLKKSGTLDQWAASLAAGILEAFDAIIQGGVKVYEVLNYISNLAHTRAAKSLQEQISENESSIRKGTDYLVSLSGNTSGKIAQTAMQDVANLKKANEGLKAQLKSENEAIEQSYRNQIRADEISGLAKKWRAKAAAAPSAAPTEPVGGGGFHDKFDEDAGGADEEQKKLDALADAERKAELIRLKADQDTFNLILDHSYQEGLTSIESYYSQKILKTKEAYDEELAIIQKAMDELGKSGETDAEAAAKYAELSAAYYAKRKEEGRALVQLQWEENAALEEQKKKRQEILDLLDQIRREAAAGPTPEGPFSELGNLALLPEKQKEEMADLKKRQEEHIANLREMKATEAQIEEAAARHRVEIEKLTLTQIEQERIQALQGLAQVAQFAEQGFASLYELSGRKAKEWFYAMKAMQVAQAMIGASMAIIQTLALPLIPMPAKMVMAAIIGAAAMAQVAAIIAQNPAMWEGGWVPGSSPHKHADNVWVRATAKEFMLPVDAAEYYAPWLEGLRRKLIPREVFAGLNFRFSPPAISTRSAYATGGMVAPPSTAASGPGAQVTIINVTDAREIDRYLATPQGQNAVLNILSGRSQALKKILIG